MCKGCVWTVPFCRITRRCSGRDMVLWETREVRGNVKHERPEQDPNVIRLAEALELPQVAAVRLRSMLFEFVVDVRGTEDVSDVSTDEWALALRCSCERVASPIDAFEAAGLLQRNGNRLLVSDWDQVNRDDQAASVRRWMRSRPGVVVEFAELLELQGE